MKAFRKLIAIAALALISLSAYSQTRMFGEFANNKDITTVYISGAAMRMGLSMAGDSSSPLGQVTESIKNPQGMEVVSTENPQAAETVRKTAGEIIARLGMELLLNTTDEDENVNIYVGRMLDGSVMRDILIETSEASEYTLVYIKGDVDIESLTKP